LAFRIGYGLLAIFALFTVFSSTAYFMGWSFTKYLLNLAFARPFYAAMMLVEYSSFIGAAVMITLRRDMERWIAVVIGLIGVYMLYQALWPMFEVGLYGGMMFWLQPVLFLVGAAAVWRIGSLLHAQAASQRYALS